MINNGRLCPLLEKRHKECYTNSMNSQNIEDVIYYCGGNYEECEIYRKNLNLRRGVPDAHDGVVERKKT